MSKGKLNLLVIPSMFPRYRGDMYGIFVLDYIKAVESRCSVLVLNISVTGESCGLRRGKIGKVDVISYVVAEKMRRGLLKFVHQVIWFFQGWNIGRKERQINIIHAHGSTLAGNLALLIGRTLNVPVVITEHAGPFSRLMRNRFTRYLTRNALEKADCVLFVSKDLESQVHAFDIKPRKSVVTYNPVDTDLFVPGKESGKTERRNMLFVGRLEPYKGALRCVRAFRNIMDQYRDWTITIVGDGSEYAKILTELENDEQLQSRTVLTGALSKTEIARHMQLASIFVYPSEHETFGIVIAEAMSAGLPVLVGDETAPPEFVDSEIGRLVNATDIAGIASAMSYMIEHLPEYDPDAIRTRAVSDFGFNEFSSRLMSVYTGLA